VADVEGGDLPRVNRAEIGHELVQPSRSVPEVEAAQPLDAMLVAGRDAVQVVLHAGGEVVVDEPAEVLLEQSDDGEGEEGRDEGRAALEDVAAVEDRAEDRRVHRLTADPELLKHTNQHRLGETDEVAYIEHLHVTGYLLDK